MRRIKSLVTSGLVIGTMVVVVVERVVYMYKLLVK